MLCKRMRGGAEMDSENSVQSQFRLGFWNRLAVVAVCLFTLGFPTWRVFEINEERRKVASDGYHNCINGISAFHPPDMVSQCSRLWHGGASYLGWEEWLILSGVSLAMALIGYAIIRFFVMVGKWVWRGRRNST